MGTWLDTGSALVNLATGEQVAAGPQMMIGAHNLPTDATAWAGLEAVTGPMGIRRSYSGNIPSTAPSVLTMDYDIRASWHSVKGTWSTTAAGGYDATITSFLNSIPSDHFLMLTIDHEPENDGGVASQWRAAQAHFYDVVKSVRPQTLVGPILMGYTFNPSSGRNVADWTISGDDCDFYGIDEYNPYLFPMVGSPTNWVNQPSPTLQAFTNLCDTLGVPGAVGETASAEHLSDPNRKIGWMHDMVDYCTAQGFLAYCWFNAYKPGDTSEAMMLDSSPAFLAEWVELVASHPEGLVTP